VRESSGANPASATLTKTSDGWLVSNAQPFPLSGPAGQ